MTAFACFARDEAVGCLSLDERLGLVIEGLVVAAATLEQVLSAGGLEGKLMLDV